MDELVSCASDIKEYALQQALSGKEWTDFKLVEGCANRRYNNQAAVKMMENFMETLRSLLEQVEVFDDGA